jgi:hypothetical protein
MFPKPGAANTPMLGPFGRKHCSPATFLNLKFFDSIMVRKFEEHPNKISSVLFYLASIIIHGMLANPCYAAIVLLTALCQISFAQITTISTTL